MEDTRVGSGHAAFHPRLVSSASRVVRVCRPLSYMYFAKISDHSQSKVLSRNKRLAVIFSHRFY